MSVDKKMKSTKEEKGLNSRYTSDFNELVTNERNHIVRKYAYGGNIFTYGIYGIYDYFYYSELFTSMLALRVIFVAINALIYFKADMNAKNSSFWLCLHLIMTLTFLMIITGLTGTISSPYTIAIIPTLVLYGLIIGIKEREIAFFLLSPILFYWAGAFLVTEGPYDYGLMVFMTALFVSAVGFVKILSGILTKRAYDAFLLNMQVSEKAEALRKQHDELVKMDIAKTKLLAGISHEFRTPLTLILSPIESLISNLTDKDAVKSYLKISEKEGLRLLRLVNNLLSTIAIIEKGDSAKNALNIQIQDLKSILVPQTKSFELSAKAKGLEFSFKDMIDSKAYVEGDRDSLEKILSNPIMNAIKYTPEGYVHIELFINKKGNIQIDVSDTGIGMEFEKEDDIFEPFITGTNATNSGTGLGLSLTKRLVELHGGSVSIDKNKQSIGTTISIELPRTEGKNQVPTLLENDNFSNLYNSANTALVTSEEFTEGQLEKRIERQNVLIVDDEISMREFLVSIFKNDFNVIPAKDGESAVEIIKNQDIDLAILDLMLPGIDGREVSKQIKQLSPECKMIMLTANQAPIIREQALNGPIDAFFDKPFNKKELVYEVEKLLNVEHSEIKQAQSNLDLSVLIVEDNKELAGLLAKQLPVNVDYDYVGTTEELKKAIAEKDYDLITADKYINGGNAYEVLEEMTNGQDSKEGSIIVGLSGSMDSMSELPEFMYDMIYKPFRESEIQQKFKLYLKTAAYRKNYSLMHQELIDHQETYIQQEKLATLGETVLNLVHEINNPLTYAMDAVMVLKEMTSSELDESIINEIADDLQQGLNQIHFSTKNLSSYGYNEAQKKKSIVYLDEAIESAIKIMHVKKQGIDVQVICGHHPVFGSENELIQVFINLIKNASRAMKDSERKEIQIKVEEDGPTKLWVQFKDYGSGVPKSVAVTLFDPYVTSSEKGKGTGLGLNICRMIIEGHDGSMFFAGNNPGAEFRIILPKAVGLIGGDF
ncbi:hypothetical protein A3715_00010 [Oleiphilus sp. HI0009]|nr:hypothetical protein A3715_00010 [Oleiphilus sp. HI0009]